MDRIFLSFDDTDVLSDLAALSGFDRERRTMSAARREPATRPIAVRRDVGDDVCVRDVAPVMIGDAVVSGREDGMVTKQKKRREGRVRCGGDQASGSGTNPFPAPRFAPTFSGLASVVEFGVLRDYVVEAGCVVDELRPAPSRRVRPHTAASSSARVLSEKMRARARSRPTVGKPPLTANVVESMPTRFGEPDPAWADWRVERVIGLLAQIGIRIAEEPK